MPSFSILDLIFTESIKMVDGAKKVFMVRARCF